jgi:hypothetical protein
VTLTLARVLLTLLLLGFVARQCFSIIGGLDAVAFEEQSDAYTGEPDVLEYVFWPIGWLLVSVGLVASSVGRLVSDRRTIAAFATLPGATVRDDRLELLVVCRFGRRTELFRWSEVAGARLFSDALNARHVVVRIGHRRVRLAPYLERAEDLVAEIERRAERGRAA